MNKFPTLLIALALLGSGGCGPIALKQGSSAADLHRDEAECRAQQPTDEGTSKCLRDKGWTITQFSAPDSAVAASPATSVAPASVSPTSATPSTDSAKAPSENSVALAPKAVAPDAAVNPQAKVTVQSWWKAGAQAADFNSDANTCVALLGTDHTPDYAARLYSNGLVNCLREHGWRAGYNPVYTAPR